MFQIINKISKNHLTIAYKLLNDLLLICLVFFFFMLIGESLLPGIISTRISFTAIIVLILLDALLIRKLTALLNIENKNKINKKALFIGAAILAIFILNGLINLFRFNAILAIFVFLIILLIGYYIYKLVFED